MAFSTLTDVLEVNEAVGATSDGWDTVVDGKGKELASASSTSRRSCWGVKAIMSHFRQEVVKSRKGRSHLCNIERSGTDQ